MTLWPDTVILDGSTIPLAGVLADLTIRHGRTDVSDEPTAATCQLTLLPVDKALVSAFEVGQSLQVTARDGAAPSVPRFSGHVTDGRLEADELTLIAVGAIAEFRLYTIGAVNWPAETWSSRVTRCFTEAGIAGLLELQADPTFNPLLVARDTTTAGATTLGDYLAFLAPMVGAAIVDKPDGGILVQAIGARTLDAAVELDPADVSYSPVWLEELPRGNQITVRYTGDQSEEVYTEDAASVVLYGERPERIDTTFQDVVDANARASLRLGRSAYPHWNIPECALLRGLELELGAPVILDGMPPASPFEPWTPILEGWTDTITGDDWTMLLSLSDPLLSGVTVPWSAVPATADYHWDTVDTATDWTEALTLEDLKVG